MIDFVQETNFPARNILRSGKRGKRRGGGGCREEKFPSHQGIYRSTVRYLSRLESRTRYTTPITTGEEIHTPHYHLVFRAAGTALLGSLSAWRWTGLRRSGMVISFIIFLFLFLFFLSLQTLRLWMSFLLFSILPPLISSAGRGCWLVGKHPLSLLAFSDFGSSGLPPHPPKSNLIQPVGFGVRISYYRLL